MKECYKCDWCHDTFDDMDECEQHEQRCHENPAAKACETCRHHGTVMAGTGKVWYTCAAGLLESPRWVENHASDCPKWRHWNDAPNAGGVC